MPFAIAAAAVTVAGAVVTGIGQAKSASAAKKAASTNQVLAEQNAQVSQSQTDLKLMQQQRAGQMTQGAASAAAGASGLKAEGSVLDVLHSNAANIALDRSAISVQGYLDKAGWGSKAADYAGQAKQAGAATWGAVGGALSTSASAYLNYKSSAPTPTLKAA